MLTDTTTTEPITMDFWFWGRAVLTAGITFGLLYVIARV